MRTCAFKRSRINQEAKVLEDRLLISEGASKALFNLLSNGGVLRGRTIDQVHERLILVVNQLWDGGKAASFVDDRGGGWMIDISKGFSDMMLYAIVRDTNDHRAVVDVIDEGEVTEVPSKTSKTPSIPPPPPPQPIQKRTTEVLVRWVKTTARDQGVDSGWEEKRLLYHEVESEVQRLLAKGSKAEEIEIWTEVKRPRVSVTLV